MRYAMIYQQYKAYAEAMAVLRANYRTVAERKAAIDIRDEFVSAAPSFVKELLDGFEELRGFTDGEECADPESCNTARGNPVWLCSRCRIRELIPEA